jgi:integrase
MPRRQKPNVVKNADGTYSVRLRAPEGYRLPDGSPSPKRPTYGPFKSERDAERAGWKEIDRFEQWDPDAPPLVAVPPTFDALVDEYLAGYTRKANSKRTLTHRLRYARHTFGPKRLERITLRDAREWRASLPPASAWGLHKAARQVTSYAVTAGYVASNIFVDVDNPEPQRGERSAFRSWREVEAVAGELADATGLFPGYRAIPIFAAGTGLRPEEWIPLRMGDLDLSGPVPIVHVRRTYTAGILEDKTGTKGKGARRRVPLRAEVVAALRAHGALRPGLDPTALLFPARRGGLINLNEWRRNDWNTAIEAAGIAPRRTPYDLRHTFATFQIAAGMNLFALARRMGTSLQEIEATYGHLAPDQDKTDVEAMDEYDRKLRDAEKDDAETASAASAVGMDV